MILFETTTSVFQLLWDIALFLFITRLSFYYFILSYLSSLFITYLRLSRLQPINHLTQPQAELITLPIWLLLSTLFARYLIVWYEIPRVAGFRLAIGVVAGVFLILAELVGGVVMWERGWRVWIWETDVMAAVLGIGVLVAFMLMPWLLMGVERKRNGEEEEEETRHGHEKKSVVRAVPSVARSEKDAETRKSV
ncbi:hypothetical protein DL95DRAFT_391574 [Leptodontidium sp. 2 PMI_412]|nr:hypothetical protein DL95DRAFT_391574 [Leptodontidium sp. 2 PMI_412]